MSIQYLLSDVVIDVVLLYFNLTFTIWLCSIPLTLEWSPSAPHDLILTGCHDGTVNDSY